MSEAYWLGTIQLNRHNLDDLLWRVRMAQDVSEAIDNVHAWVQSHATGDEFNSEEIKRVVYETVGDPP